LPQCIWLHAVSVGEMRAAQPLITRLAGRYPRLPILVSCMTPTGRETAHALYGDAVRCVYLPYDFFSLQRRLVRHFNPVALLIMETEIWPNLLAACWATDVPAFLLNARMSEKSQRGYARFSPVRRLAGDALRTLRAVAVQSTADAGRFIDLGATNVVVTGNIKFDQSLDPQITAMGLEWRKQLPAGVKVLLAASTREGEEMLLLDAYCRTISAEERHGFLLVIVPRHPQRVDAVEALIRARVLATGRRSRDALSGKTFDVWLGDSMGEMAAYVAMCDVAFIGGSLLPMGGQNLIEACAQGKPVIMGPSTFNFAEAARLAAKAGALRLVADADAVMAAAKVLLGDDRARAEMSSAALTFAQTHAGATERTLALIAPVIAPVLGARAG
jgi:3-deoxy-D-manno-octulosonic-acid transferase